MMLPAQSATSLHFAFWDVYVSIGWLLFARQKSISAFFSPSSCSCSKQLVLVSLPTLCNGFTRTNKFMSSVMATVILNYLGCFIITKKIGNIWLLNLNSLFFKCSGMTGISFLTFSACGIEMEKTS